MPRAAPVKPVYSRPKTMRPAEAVAPSAATGLLQLTLGRHASGYGIAAAVAFYVNVFFLFIMVPPNPGDGILDFWELHPGYWDYVLWLAPSALGAIASWDAIRLKREAYRRHYASRHFVVSTLGFVLFFFVAAVIVLSITFPAFYGLFVPLRVWIYPITVAGVPLTIISLAMTWQGLTARKVGSIVLACVMPVLVTLFILFGYVPDRAGDKLPFMVVTLTGALSTVISGNLLHIIASSTSVYQREIIKADNTKLALLQQELQKRREALDYKERSIRGRESHVEILQKDLDEQAVELKTKIVDVTAREVAVERSTKELRDLERRVSGAKAEIEARVEEFKLKEMEVGSAKSELEKARQSLAARESKLNEVEKDVKRKSIELTSQVRSVDDRVRALAEQEERVRAVEKSLEEKRTTLLQQEKAIQLKESELKLRAEQVDATTSKVEATRLKELKDWESKVLAKEKDLGKLEVELRTLENQLKERYENATRIERRFQEQRKMMEDRESELVAREKAVSDREGALEDRLEDLERQSSSATATRAGLEERARKYAELLKEAKMKEAAVGSSQEEIKARMVALDEREKKMVAMQANLQAEIKRLNDENRQLLEKGKEIEARESEIGLREMELEQRAIEARAAAATPGMRDLDREAQLEEWERRLREREEDLKRRMYQREKEIEMREAAVKAQVSTEVTEAAPEAVAAEAKAEKAKTGNARLDDLLYGGIPFNSNILFVGPAFAGKEVAILNFIAEGLRKGIPCILITTMKPAIDVARDMAPILPTFVQYEQLGLVRWIDASPAPGGKAGLEKNVWRVNGATDLETILQLVDRIDDEFKGKYPYFRLAFLTLSSCITQADEKDALSFFQRLMNRLRQTKAVSAVALERGMHADQTIDALEHMVDGALHFKVDKQKHFLQVAGLGDVQTRDWVPYKFTNKAIMIGSFQLERIR